MGALTLDWKETEEFLGNFVWGDKAFFTAGKALTHWPLRLRRDIILTATAVFDNGRLVAYSVATKPHITTDSSDKSMAGT